MSDFTRNVPICHRCPKRDGGTCTADDKGEEIAAKATAHACPLDLFSPRGAGDVIAHLLSKTGIGPIAKAIIERVTGKPCGCPKRIVRLNQQIPLQGEK